VAKGKVKWFNDQKGFGFIAPDDGSEEVFLHSSSIVGGYTTMAENEPVSYDKAQSDKGPRAANVQKLSTIPPPQDEAGKAQTDLGGPQRSSLSAGTTSKPYKAKAILAIFLFGTLLSIGLGFIVPMLGLICFSFTVTAMWSQWKRKS
jgi:cold shock protein